MRRTPLAPLALAALIGSACSLITRFDDGTQACDDQAPVGQQCLGAYNCVNGHCVSMDSGAASFDAGTLDGGTPDAGAIDAGKPDAGKLDAGTADAGDGGH